MILARSLIYYTLLALTIAAFGLPLALFGWVLPNSVNQAVCRRWALSNLWLQGVVCGLNYQAEGLQHIPQDAPVIVMSKHQSAWETIALRGLISNDQAWVLKRELIWLPVFGWALATTRPIAIDRNAGRKAARQVIDQGMRRLAEGATIIIFPEGTRTEPGTRRKYAIGGGLLAEKSKRPVVPIAHNAGVFWKRRGLRKLPGTIRVIVGSPILTEGKSAAAITRDVEQWIEARQQELPAAP